MGGVIANSDTSVSVENWSEKKQKKDYPIAKKSHSTKINLIWETFDNKVESNRAIARLLIVAFVP
jgi:hypothetical protein